MSTLIIESIKLKNAGPFDDEGLTINFGSKQNKDKANIHILVGESGSGKTLVLDALTCLNSFIEPELYCVVRDLDNRIIYDCEKQDFSNCREVEIQTNLFEFNTKITNNNKKILYRNKSSDGEVSEEVKEYFLKNYIFVNNEEVSTEKFIKKFLDNYIQAHFISEGSGFQFQKYFKDMIEQTQKILSDLLEKDFELNYDKITNIASMKIDGKDVNSELPSGQKAIMNIVFTVFNYFNLRTFVNKMSLCYDSHFFLLLDEVDIHLAPKAQRKILPALQKLFPNAEIFCTTHSPFVVNSVSDAWVYELDKKIGVIEPI